MNQEPDVNHQVQMIARPRENEIRESISKRVAQMIAEFAASRRTGSGALLASERAIVVDAFATFVDVRMWAEREVHTRRGLSFTEQRREAVIEQLLLELGVIASRMHTQVPLPGGEPMIEQSRTEALARAREIVRDHVIALWVELSLPPPPALAAPITVNVNAPNHGVVAGRIDSLTVTNAEAGAELQDALREILEAIEKLNEDARSEARALLFELTQQADSKPQRGLVRAGAARLAQLLSLAGNLERAIGLAQRLPDLIDRSAWIIS